MVGNAKFPRNRRALVCFIGDHGYSNGFRYGVPGTAMQIRVKCVCGEGDCKEWAIFELQGVMEASSSIGDQLQNVEIGRLCCTSQSAYTFTVGYHELSGKKVALKKPFLVLKKTKTDSFEGKTPTTSLEVVGIIRYRILFKDRPKALISAPHPKAKKTVPPCTENTVELQRD